MWAQWVLLDLQLSLDWAVAQGTVRWREMRTQLTEASRKRGHETRAAACVQCSWKVSSRKSLDLATWKYCFPWQVQSQGTDGDRSRRRVTWKETVWWGRAETLEQGSAEGQEVAISDSMALTVSDTATWLCHRVVAVATDTSKCAMLYSSKTLLVDNEDWISYNLLTTKYFSSWDFFFPTVYKQEILRSWTVQKWLSGQIWTADHSMPTPMIN